MKAADLSEELRGGQFGDERLSKRASRIADALSRKPNFSLPAALRSRADREACYRFCDNDKVTPEKILQPHIDATYQRINQVDFVLLVQDTTEIDLTRPAKIGVSALLEVPRRLGSVPCLKCGFARATSRETARSQAREGWRLAFSQEK